MITEKYDEIHENKVIHQCEIILGKITRIKSINEEISDKRSTKAFKCMKAEEIKQCCENIKGLCESIIEEN